MVYYDPYMPEVIEDPYPVYARLRREAPVYYLERFDAWVLSRFEDIWQASQDRVHYSTANSTADLPFLKRQPAAMEVLSTMDPPAHTELRTLLFPHFGPAAARALESEVRQWTRRSLEPLRDRGCIDALRELAQPVAVRVACRVSGFPVEDADYLVDLVTRFMRREPGVEGISETGAAASAEIWTYLASVVRARAERGSQRVDALAVLLERMGDDSAAQERVARHLTLLLVGATETFPKVFANGLLRLWQHPEQRGQLVAHPGRIDTALTEILRYDMPTQWLGRTVIAEHEIDGHKLRMGQPVLFLYPSGNRDELEFDEPERFDIARNPPRILSFGHGVHRCLGAFVARMEGRVLLSETLRAAPGYEVLRQELVRSPTEFVQGYASFPIAGGTGSRPDF